MFMTGESNSPREPVAMQENHHLENWNQEAIASFFIENDFWDHLAREIPPVYRLGQEGCPTCRGMGIVLDPQGGGWDEPAFRLCQCLEKVSRCDGKGPYEYYEPSEDAMLPCPTRPARLALERIRYLRKLSAVPKRYSWKFLPSIDQTVTSFMMALDYATELIRVYGRRKPDEPVRGLYFHGQSGTGKTLLSCIVLNELIRLYQVRVQYAKISRDILGKLRSTFNPNSEQYGEGNKIEENLATVPVLVIDDFGVHTESNWVNMVLYDLIDARYENNLVTILTSNDPIDSWKEVARGRVYSRLKEMCEEVKIDAEDYRLRKPER